MSERQLNLIVVAGVVSLIVAGIVALIVWWQDGQQLPKGQDSMESMASGLVQPIAERRGRPRLVAAGRRGFNKSDCVTPPNHFVIEGARCIIGDVPPAPIKPLILVAPTPKSAR